MESKEGPESLPVLEQKLIEQGFTELGAHQIAELASLVERLSSPKLTEIEYKQIFENAAMMAENLRDHGETEKIRIFAKTILEGMLPSKKR